MEWVQKVFNELATMELYTILKERVDVFVVEQNCPYPEIDNYDLISTHLYLVNDGEIVAYCRLLPSQSIYPESSIGRVLVKEKFRNQGLARKLMSKAIEVVKNDWKEQQIKLHAQAHLQDFYGSFGFVPISEEHIEDGIPHVEMLLIED